MNVSLPEIEKAILRLGGKVTTAQVAAEVLMSVPETENSLRRLAQKYLCHLLVTEDGEIIYDFGKTFEPRVGTIYKISEFLKIVFYQLWRGFVFAFKIWIVLMMVVYFIFYVCCLIALFILAGGKRLPNLEGVGRLFLRLIKHIRKKEEVKESLDDSGIVKGKNLWEMDVDTDQYRMQRKTIPYYEKVFLFVFGKIKRVITLKVKERCILEYIKENKGVVVASELCGLLGLSLDEAEAEIARIYAKYQGEIDVTEDGVLIYRFPALIRDFKLNMQEPPDKRLWLIEKYDGNKVQDKYAEIQSNFFLVRVLLDEAERGVRSEYSIPLINGFNLTFAVAMEIGLMDTIGIPRERFEFLVVWFPMLFSFLFFLIPIGRWIVSIMNKHRSKEELFRARFLKMVATKRKKTRYETFEDNLSQSLGLELSDVDFKLLFHKMLIEYRGEIEGDESNLSKSYLVFHQIWNEIQGVEKKRKEIREDMHHMGTIVYSTLQKEI